LAPSIAAESHVLSALFERENFSPGAAVRVGGFGALSRPRQAGKERLL
jgi:hypothetical protein